jgi:hypothetical protein
MIFLPKFDLDAVIAPDAGGHGDDGGADLLHPASG